MSAFICSPDHFKALALFAASRRHGSLRVDPRYMHAVPGLDPSRRYADRGLENLTHDELATVYANCLYAENVRSVEKRYPDNSVDSLPGLIHKPAHIVVTSRDCTRSTLQVQPVALLKMCDCLEYQSCETEDYRQTVAFELLGDIRRAAIRTLVGYDDAPWEFYVEEMKATA